MNIFPNDLHSGFRLDDMKSDKSENLSETIELTVNKTSNNNISKNNIGKINANKLPQTCQTCGDFIIVEVNSL